MRCILHADENRDVRTRNMEVKRQRTKKFIQLIISLIIKNRDSRQISNEHRNPSTATHLTNGISKCFDITKIGTQISVYIYILYISTKRRTKTKTWYSIDSLYLHKFLNGHEQTQRTLQMLMRTRSYIRTKYTVKALNEKKKKRRKKQIRSTRINHTYKIGCYRKRTT